MSHLWGAVQHCHRNSASTNAFHSCGMCSLTAVMLVTNSETHAPKLASGQSKSSSDPTPPRALFCCREDGSSSGPSHGWDATAASPKTSSEPSKAQLLGSILLQSNKSPAESQVHEFMPNQYESDSKACANARVAKPLGLGLAIPYKFHRPQSFGSLTVRVFGGVAASSASPQETAQYMAILREPRPRLHRSSSRRADG